MLSESILKDLLFKLFSCLLFDIWLDTKTAAVPHVYTIINDEKLKVIAKDNDAILCLFLPGG